MKARRPPWMLRTSFCSTVTSPANVVMAKWRETSARGKTSEMLNLLNKMGVTALARGTRKPSNDLSPLPLTFSEEEKQDGWASSEAPTSDKPANNSLMKPYGVRRRGAASRLRTTNSLDIVVLKSHWADQHAARLYVNTSLQAIAARSTASSLFLFQFLPSELEA